MDLATYLKSEELTPTEFAQKMGKSSASGVIKWLRGERTPRPNEQRKIFEVTKGKVTPTDFVIRSAA